MARLASTAIVLALALAAGAAQAQQRPVQSVQTQAGPPAQILPSIPQNAMTVTHWYKQSVYDPSDNKIGNVTDLMVDSNGTVTAMVVSVGGFLGINQKEVVIPFKELKVSTRDGKDWLVLNRTKDELKSAPAYDNTGSPAEYRGKGGDIR